MSKKWRLTERTRTLLTLELAIVLPAAALMAFSIFNLKHIQKDRAIEAAIQRDFSHVLLIAEKKSWLRGNDLLAPIRKEFPNSGDSTKVKSELAHLLASHPELAYAAYYDKTKNMFVSATQPRHSEDMAFCGRAEDNLKMIEGWFSVEGPDMVGHLRLMEQEDEPPVGFNGGWTLKDNLRTYWNAGYFLPPELGKGRVALGVVSFDEEYLRTKFFPSVIQDTLKSKSGFLRSDANPPAMMIHSTKDPTPWVASANWDGGKPEVEKNLGEVLGQGFALAIKYPGTTIADIGSSFLRNNYIILGALSLLMAGGIFLSYRNVSREMNLARLKSDFVANVSHELRTPLALIRLYAETLELGRLTAKEKYHEYFRIIREESERLTALINNILDFSRIEAGRKEYEFKETNLSDLVRATLDSYRFQIEQHGFAFEENISGDIPPVNVDREAIARSLLNLVNNALKYSKDKKYIGVSLYRANGSVKLEVSDHGIGIPPAEQEKIFEKFYRCGDPLVHNIKGSGLGLSLVRHIARAHGGDVQVESTPEKGSKFTIALPIHPSTRTGEAIA
jgi:signal transduction histidine kinase